MIQLYKYIKESLLDDEDVLMKDTGDEVIKNEILKFLKDNYIDVTKYKISKKPINGKYVVDCSHNLQVKNRNINSLTNGYFEFGVVNGYFDCSGCDSLTSLEGAPKEVSKFYCHHCNSLTSLKCAPKEVNGDFNCVHCKTQFIEDDVKKVSKVKGKIFY